MEIAFIDLVTLTCYVDRRNNVYNQLTFLCPTSPLFVEIFNKCPGRLFKALQCDFSDTKKANKLRKHY